MKKIFVSLMVMTIAMSAFAYDQAVEGTKYWGSKCQAVGLADGTVVIDAFYLDEDQTDVVFPATIQVWDGEVMTAEYEVSQVGNSYNFWFDFGGADKTTAINSITIPEGVKAIGAAFWGTTALAELNLPASLESIAAYAFGGATALATINYVGSNAPTVGEDVFAWSLIENSSCTVYCKDAATVETFNQDPWTYWTGFYQAGLVKVKGGTTTAINNTEASVKAHKIIRDGQVLVERNGTFFNLTGAIVK